LTDTPQSAAVSTSGTRSTATRARSRPPTPTFGIAYAGTDIVVVREGQIAALYLFFDPLTA
jgi:hypothetical protein